MSEKTLKFDNVRDKKLEFHKAKQPIDLHLVNLDLIVVLHILLVAKKVKLLNRYVLSYLK